MNRYVTRGMLESADETNIGFQEAITVANNGIVTRTRDLFAWGMGSGGKDEPVECNGVAMARCGPGGTGALIESVEARFRDGGGRFVWLIGPSTIPKDLHLPLMARGYALGGIAPIMALHMEGYPVAAVLGTGSGIETKPLEGSQEREAYLGILQKSLGLSEARAAHLGNALAKGTVQSFAAVVAGRTVGGCCALHGLGPRGNASGIYCLAVDECYRKRGIGTALMARILGGIKGAEGKYAYLTATPMGYSLYRRLGFYDICGYTTLISPGNGMLFRHDRT